MVKVLFVEDHFHTYDWLRLVLSSLSHEVTGVYNESMALYTIREVDSNFDLFLTEANLPAIKGTELVTQVKDLGYTGLTHIWTDREHWKCEAPIKPPECGYKPRNVNELDKMIKEILSPNP